MHRKPKSKKDTMDESDSYEYGSNSLDIQEENKDLEFNFQLQNYVTLSPCGKPYNES